MANFVTKYTVQLSCISVIMTCLLLPLETISRDIQNLTETFSAPIVCVLLDLYIEKIIKLQQDYL